MSKITLRGRYYLNIIKEKKKTDFCEAGKIGGVDRGR